MEPATEDDLAGIIRDAEGPLRITGGGTRPIGRPAAGAALSTRGLTGITLYDPGALTLVVRAGTPVAEVEAALAAENQRLAFEPMDHRRVLGTEGAPTIGGVVAANVSGPRRIMVGAARDFLLGVRFVDGAGQIVKNGGRVMKNVTGYDLVKLMAGSHGTLGVLTEVSFKVLPDVAAEATLVLTGLDDARAVAAMSAALGSPFEVSGVAHHGSETLFRLEGFRDSVAYRSGKLAALLAPYGTVAEVADSRARWAAIRDVVPLADVAGDLWRISVKPSDAPALLAAVAPRAHLLDWGGGLIWAVTDPGHDLRAAMSCPGHATLLRSDSDLPRFHPEPAPLAALARGLRARFDPRGILNPGVMG